MSDSAAAARRVGVVTFIGGLGGGLVFPILPALGLKLGIAGGLIGLILSANRISRVLFDSTAGRLVDRFGARLPLAAGMLLESVGILGYSAGLHFGHAAAFFLGGRVVFGVGSSLLFVGSQAAVLAFSSAADRGRRVATVRIALSLGLPGGLVFGGIAANLLSDDAAFLIGAAVTLVGALAALWLVPSPPPRPEGAEGAAPERPRGLVERLRRLRALPELPLLGAAWGFNLLIFLSVQGVLLATLVVMVQARHLTLLGLKAQGTSGVLMAVTMACGSIVAVALGRLLDRTPLRTGLVIPSVVGVAAGFGVLAYAESLGLTVVGAVLIGASFNGITLPLLTLLGDATRPQDYGRAVGLYQLFGDVGGSIGPIVGLAVALHVGLPAAYLGTGAILLAGLPAALWAYRHERRWRA